jgi:DNA sulfur modification protein DndB
MSSYTVPAIAGRMGSTEYYQAVMRADELAATVKAAMDFKEFDTFMASERMQRKLSEERVEAQIVPYLTNSADRFFGSIIVLVYDPKEFVFEPLKSFNLGKLPTPYSSLESNIGMLTISGGKLFALDGQHRLHALRTVINEKRTPHLGMPITGPFKDDVRGDQLSVIFLKFTSVEKARRIFNKVNRYAKPTSKSTNILTSEDDGHAIIARSLAALDDPGKFDSDVVSPLPLTLINGKDTLRLEGSSLKQADPHLSTLELVYKSVEAICNATGQPALDEKTTITRPDDTLLRTAYDECARWWGALINDFVPFKSVLSDPFDLPAWRQHDHRYSLALRPNGQEAIIRGLMEAHRITKLSPRTLVDRLNKIPISFSNRLWHGVLLGGGDQRVRVLAFSPLAANLVTYLLIGPDNYGARRLASLDFDYREAKKAYGLSATKLPDPVV